MIAAAGRNTPNHGSMTNPLMASAPGREYVMIPYAGLLLLRRKRPPQCGIRRQSASVI
jgi:hypothetical protein